MRISDWSSDVCHSSRCAGMLRRQAPRTLVPHYRLFSSRCRRGIEEMLCVTGREEARLDSPSVTAGGAAIKARGYPPIFFENRFPPRPLRGAALRSAALTRSEEHTSELQ